MGITIVEIGPSRLTDYATVPSQVLVSSILQPRLLAGGLGGILLEEELIDTPYVKDYDSDGELPTDWPKKYDVRKWGFFLATKGEYPVGGAAIAFATSELFMLEGRRDLSVLWDLRVRPEAKGAGIPLFRQAANWSREHGCTQMKIETQNVNLPASRFYQKMGAKLGEIRRYGYAAIPAVAHEIMLCWYLDLGMIEHKS